LEISFSLGIENRRGLREYKILVGLSVCLPH